MVSGPFYVRTIKALLRSGFFFLPNCHDELSIAVLEALRSPRRAIRRNARRGEHSIRINQQWRVCFRWKDGHVHDVAIVDYHR